MQSKPFLKPNPAIGAAILMVLALLIGCNTSDDDGVDSGADTDTDTDSDTDGSIGGEAVYIDHTNMDIDAASQAQLDAARAIRMTIDHASIGGNIVSGLDALEAGDASSYAYPNWDWHYRGNPGSDEKVTEFAGRVATDHDGYDVLMMKFCWIDSWTADWEGYRDAMLDLEATYPDKTFVWWTVPVSSVDDGQKYAAEFNDQARSYCLANGKHLFDIADIESREADGDLCTINGYEALCSEYAGPDNTGHLGATGQERMAKAIWALMVQLAN